MGLIWTILTQPWTIIAIFVMIAAAAAYAYLAGVPKLMKLAADWRMWVAAIAAVAIIGTANLDRKVEDLQQQVQVEEVQADSFADASDIIVERAQRQRTRSAERERIVEAQHQAPPGEEVDAVLDAIAAEDRRRAGDDAGA